MPRKNPYHIVRITARIYDALESRLEADTEGAYKTPSMNQFIEELLWDYVQDKLIRREGIRRVRVVTAVGRGESPKGQETGSQSPHQSGKRSEVRHHKTG